MINLAEGQPNNDLVVDGDVVVKDNNGITRIRLDSDTGSIFVHNADGDIVLQWEMPGNNLRFGGHNRDGDLLLFSQVADGISDANNATFHLNTQSGDAFIGGGGIAGRIVCRDGNHNQRLLLDSVEARIVVGASGQTGSIIVQNEDNEPRIRLDGSGANIRCGGGAGGAGDGDLLLFPGGADISNNSEASVHLNGANGTVSVGAIAFPDGTTQDTAATTGVITAVIAGDGLTGGGSSGEVELNISQEFAGVVQSLGNQVQLLQTQVQQLQFAVQQLQQGFGP